jgi:amino acid transporter
LSLLRIEEVREGLRPEYRYLRAVPRREQQFRRLAPWRWESTLAAERPRSFSRGLWADVRHLLLGSPLATAQEGQQRLSKIKALAVLASDALSSVAYATEEILWVLVAASQAFISLALPVAIAIVGLLLVVVVSYRQTVLAYPQGGGAYSVAKDNLDARVALFAAAALLIDYVLTVAVSISAGTLAIISAFPEIEEYRLQIAIGLLGLLAFVHLRGLREAGTIFAIPTYFFILMFFLMIFVGLARVGLGQTEGSVTALRSSGDLLGSMGLAGVLLLLHAFSSGAVALTGVEAIADGVRVFKRPEAQNAVTTTAWMGGILGFLFIGSAVLAIVYGVVPSEDESVISKVGRLVFGNDTPLYYLLQAATMLILVMAANTAFNDFPRLLALLARDDVLPHRFAFRGDRLVFSQGIIALAVLAAGLLVLFRADTHQLIPLYAVGVFIAFTISQSGMVRHWWRGREKSWRHAMAINAVGALTTAVVAVIIASEKFMDGAWAVLIVIPLVFLMLQRIAAYFERFHNQLRIDHAVMRAQTSLPPDHTVVLPIGDLNKVSLQALQYACTLSSNVIAVHVVTEEDEDIEGLERRWSELVPDVPIAIIQSSYRSFLAPLMAFIDSLPVARREPLTVVVPEFVPKHRWHWLLHNRVAPRLRAALRSRPGTVVVEVPQHLR